VAGAELTVLRVFCNEEGEHGNPLGVFFDEGAVPEERRQAVARDLGYSETVFIDDSATGRCRIYTPEKELPFAGHPCVGTAWLLAEKGEKPAVLRPPAGEIAVRFDDDLVWVTARAEWAPPFAYREFESPDEIDALDPLDEEVLCWAWADEAEGKVRSRCFVPEVGITEDEATGSATLALCSRLDRPIEARQGRGSQLFARPLGDGIAEVGGRAVFDERRRYEMPGR
jgi:predicted PhzF superfamily epimerase YddE/YHI9